MRKRLNNGPGGELIIDARIWEQVGGRVGTVPHAFLFHLFLVHIQFAAASRREGAMHFSGFPNTQAAQSVEGSKYLGVLFRGGSPAGHRLLGRDGTGRGWAAVGVRAPTVGVAGVDGRAAARRGATLQ